MQFVKVVQYKKSFFLILLKCEIACHFLLCIFFAVTNIALLNKTLKPF